MGITTNKNDPRLQKERPDGQQEAYLVLSEEERSKGFVRPVRRSYVHVGRQIDLTNMIPIDVFLLDNDEFDDERKRLYKEEFKYIGYIPYPKSESPAVGRFIKQSDLEEGCYHTTTMSVELAETYAKDPNFYNATFCCGCKKHLPVEEFIWEGTQERVGS